jgi:DNA-binding GntR family transcriptional regulator
MSIPRADRRADGVRRELEQLILTGGLADGDRLDEVSLAERFGCSRTPLREALQTLAASRLVQLIPHRGAFVRHPAFEELVEMFEVMAELEAMCGRLAARRITPPMLATLRDTVIGCEAAVTERDSDRFYAENERFHLELYEAGGNRFLAEEATRLHRRLKPFRRMQLQVRGRMEQSLDEHRRVLDALDRGDGAAAAEALRDHVAIQGSKFNDLMASYRRSPLMPTPAGERP